MRKNILICGFAVVLVGAGFIPSIGSDVVSTEILGYGSETWWNNEWDYCKKITINHAMVDNNLQNFAILFHNIFNLWAYELLVN